MEREIMVIGPFVWGKGKDKAAAMKKCRQANGNRAVKSYIVHDVPAGAYVDDMGYTCWKSGEGVEPPKEIERVGCKEDRGIKV